MLPVFQKPWLFQSLVLWLWTARPASPPAQTGDPSRTGQGSGAELILALTIVPAPVLGSEGAQLGAKFRLFVTKAIGETPTFCFYLKNRLAYSECK